MCLYFMRFFKEKIGFICLIGLCFFVCIYKYILMFVILMDRSCKFGIYWVNYKYIKIYNMIFLVLKNGKKLYNNFFRKYFIFSF